jgi:hypothetical protein
LTLQSSSRLALLTFYNVSDENPLVLDIHGTVIEFNYSTFEFKNPVIGYHSNMDVVLVAKDRKTDVSARNKSAPISVQYVSNKYSKFFYEKEWLKMLGIDMDYDPDDETRKKFTLGEWLQYNKNTPAVSGGYFLPSLQSPCLQNRCLLADFHNLVDCNLCGFGNVFIR